MFFQDQDSVTHEHDRPLWTLTRVCIHFEEHISFNFFDNFYHVEKQQGQAFICSYVEVLFEMRQQVDSVGSAD